MLKYSKQTVYNVNVLGDQRRQMSCSQAKSPRRIRILTPRFGILAGLKRSVSANQALPLSTLAKKRDVSTMTTHRTLMKLRLTSFLQEKRHLLTQKMKEIHLTMCKKLLNWMKSNGSVIKFFLQTRRFSQLMRLSISGMIAR